MRGGELLDDAAVTLKCFQLRSHPVGTVAIPPLVEWNDTDMVAANQEGFLLAIVEGKSEDAVELLQKMGTHLTVECQNHLTVRLRLKVIAPLISLADLPMVVDLTVHRQHQVAVAADQRLLPGSRIDYGQSLMSHEGLVAAVDARPVGSPVTHLFRHL